MGIRVIQGSTKNLTFKLISKSSDDPLDLTSFDAIVVCFSSGGIEVDKKIVNLVGNVSISSPIITGLGSTVDLATGDPVSGAGIPSGAKVLTVDSGTQVTLDQNATANSPSDPLVFGDIVQVDNPLLGKLQATLSSEDTALLPEGSASIEAKVNISGVVRYVQFAQTLDLISRIC